VTVALDPERMINNGQPTLHALSLAALAVQEGEGVGTHRYRHVILHGLAGQDDGSNGLGGCVRD
jgi:hypothetical protein